jgi:hypothetical protein
MPKFFNANDLDFIKTISEEVVDYLVEQSVILYKVSVGESKVNLYGESIGRVYHAPANLMCIVDKEDKNVEYEGFGADKTQSVTFKFMVHRLRTSTLPIIRDVNGIPVPVEAIQNTRFGYPEIGDVIFFDKAYYEIDNIVNDKLVGGMPNIYNQVSGEFEDARIQLIASTIMVRRSQVQIEDRIY